MGAWGTGNFGNDTACDWVAEVYDPVETMGGLGLVESTLDDVLRSEGEPLDSDLGCCGLAACEVVARLSGKGGESDAHTESLDEWVQANPASIPAELTTKALQAIQCILSPESELVELWGGDRDWHQVVEELRERLQGEPQDSEPKKGNHFSLVPSVEDGVGLDGHEETQPDLASPAECAPARDDFVMKMPADKVLDEIVLVAKQGDREAFRELMAQAYLGMMPSSGEGGSPKYTAKELWGAPALVDAEQNFWRLARRGTGSLKGFFRMMLRG